MRSALVAAGLVLALSGVVQRDGPERLVEPYLRVQAALAADRLEGIAADAETIAAAAAARGDEAAPLQRAAADLQAAGDLKAARVAFGDLSAALIEYAEATDLDLGPDVKVAYCPMAARSWLQDGDRIANPYYGQSMLRCGEFKKQ